MTDTKLTAPPPLHGSRIIECSLLGTAAITTSLADLGVEGTSLLHLSTDALDLDRGIPLSSAPGRQVGRSRWPWLT